MTSNERRLPSFFIVGAAKSGTTALHRMLSMQPDIFMSDLKEPRYFTFYDEPNAYNAVVSDWDTYLRLFAGADPSQAIGEASPTYLYTWRKSIREMKRRYGSRIQDVVVVIVLRHPIERLWSQFRSLQKFDVERRPLGVALASLRRVGGGEGPSTIFTDYVGFSLYAEAVKAYRTTFRRVLIFTQEDVRDRSSWVVKEVCGALKVRFSPDAVPAKLVLNASGTLRSRWLWLVERMTYKSGFMRALGRRCLPRQWRYGVQNRLSGWMYKSTGAPAEAYALVGRTFSTDLAQLEDLVSEDVRRQVIKWRTQICERVGAFEGSSALRRLSGD